MSESEVVHVIHPQLGERYVIKQDGRYYSVGALTRKDAEQWLARITERGEDVSSEFIPYREQVTEVSE